MVICLPRGGPRNVIRALQRSFLIYYHLEDDVVLR